MVCCVQMLNVSGTATANSVFDTVFNADQAQAIAGNTQWFQFVAFGIYALTLLGVDSGKLPGWGRTAGYGFAILVLGAQLGSLFGFNSRSTVCTNICTRRSYSLSSICIGVGSAISKS